MSDPRPARAVVVGIDGSRAATHAALWAVDEAVNRDIPLRLVYVIDPSQLSAAGEGGGQSAARAALHDASRKVEATGQPVKIETEVLCGRPLTKLMQESRSAAMLCVGSVGLDHVRGRRGSVAATLAGSALCPVAVIHPSPAEPATTSQVSAVVAEVDNGVVLRHAFEEARLRGVPLRAVAVHAAETPDDVEQGSRLAHVHLSPSARPLDPALPRGAGGSGHRRRQCVPSSGRQRKAGSAVRRGLTLRARIVRCIPARMRRTYGTQCQLVGSGSWEWCPGGKGLLGR